MSERNPSETIVSCGHRSPRSRAIPQSVLWIALQVFAISTTVAQHFNPPDVRQFAGSNIAGGNTEAVVDSFVRPQDQLWLVSTRNCPDACWQNEASFCPDVRRCDSKLGWVASTFDSLNKSRVPGQVTVVYVHGNRSEWDESIQRGKIVYRNLVSCDPSATAMQFVIWSWPSDQIRGQIQDVRVKAQRTETESQYLAMFLSQLPHDAPLSLAGYSFGARIISGALHTLAGGEISGNTLPCGAVTRKPVRVVLMAAAMHHDWLLPGCRFDRALASTDRSLIVFNSADPVLKRYQFVELGRNNGIQALGYVGLPCGLDSPTAQRVSQLNVCNLIGRTHDEFQYFNSPVIFEQVQRCLLWKNVD